MCGYEDTREEPDGEVLGGGGDGAADQVEGVLGQNRQLRDNGRRGTSRLECFDGGPGEVDVEEEEKRAEASDGGLGYG